MNPIQAQVVDPRLIKGLALDVHQPIPVAEDAKIDDIRQLLKMFESSMAVGGKSMVAMLSAVMSVTRAVVEITGRDENVVELIITYPPHYNSTDMAFPCIIYTHGGGMAIGNPDEAVYEHLLSTISETVGAIVVGVKFRNSAHGHVFPAGLNDCKCALDWVSANRHSQRVSRIIMCGESGGANLSIATALLAKREGGVDKIDGVYVMCPFISGLYNPVESEEAKQFPSLQKYNNCGIVDLKCLHFMQRLYDPESLHTRDPLAWPVWASEEDLSGLPPFAISLNEADVLYDEGLTFYRKLRAAGVRVTGRSVLGTCHGGDIMGMVAIPDVFRATIYDIKAFVDGLV